MVMEFWRIEFMKAYLRVDKTNMLTQMIIDDYFHAFETEIDLGCIVK